jgi:serine/threonine-protein kinase
LVYSRLGDNERAIQAARRDSARVPLSDDAYLGTELLIDLAVTYARVGEQDKALNLVDTLLSIPSELTVAILKIDPNWDPLRDNPRYQALIDKYEKRYDLKRDP